MGKILDALKGKAKAATQSAPTAAQPNDGPMDFRFLKPLAFGLAIVLFVAVVAFAAYSVMELFQMRLGTTLIEAALATMASVGVCVGVLFIVLTSTHHPLRGLGAIVLIAWSFLVLALVALNSALRGGLLAVPEALTSIGRLVAALLAGAALVPALTLPIAAHDKGEYDSAAAAASKYLGFIAKGVGVAVSAAASVYFGLSRNINPFVAGLAGFVLESCFLWSYLMLIRAMKARDAFDVNLWRIATVAFGLFLAAVSVETISTLAQIDVPIVSALGQVGATLYVSAVGLSLILTIAAHVITSLVDIPMDKPESPARIVKPSLAHRAGMVAARPSMLADEFRRGRDAARGAPQLPAGTVLTAASVPGGAEWEMKRDGQIVASGKTASLTEAKDAANAAAEMGGDGWRVEDLARYPGGRRWARTENGRDIDVVAIPGRRPNWTMSGAGGGPLVEREAGSIEGAKAAALAAAREHKAEPVKGRDYDETGFVVTPEEGDELMRRHREMLEREAKRPK